MALPLSTLKVHWVNRWTSMNASRQAQLTRLRPQGPVVMTNNRPRKDMVMMASTKKNKMCGFRLRLTRLTRVRLPPAKISYALRLTLCPLWGMMSIPHPIGLEIPHRKYPL
jgi:hypothetical protein